MFFGSLNFTSTALYFILYRDYTVGVSAQKGATQNLLFLSSEIDSIPRFKSNLNEHFCSKQVFLNFLKCPMWKSQPEFEQGRIWNQNL